MKRLFILLVIFLIAAPFSASAAASSSVPTVQSYVIKLKTGDFSLLNPVADNINQKFNFTSSAQFSHIFSFNSSLSLKSLRIALAGSYDYLETQNSFIATANFQLSDPGFTNDPANIDRQWGLPKAGFLDAWSKTKGSPVVTVALIDTGIDETHEDLRSGAYAAGFNFLSQTAISSGTNSDDNGHGTLVAGVIAATPNNAVGIAGAVWQVTLMPLKALDSQGTGNSTDIAQAIVWAADHGANIINMSLGGIGFAHDTTLANAISYAFQKNVVIVAAAGNDVATTGGNLDQEPVFPVCDDNSQNMVIGVAATDQNDLKAEFSNFGKNCIDVTAPGKRILSTINHDPFTKAPAANAYAYASGTSLAAPFVTAEAVLLKAMFPVATNQQIRDRIISSTDNVDLLNSSQCGGHSCQGLLGAGRINAATSLQQPIVTQVIAEGDLVQVAGSGVTYYMSGGKRHLVSSFVLNQRFVGVPVKQISQADLDKFADGTYAEPLDGTLIKTNNDSTIFYMSKGLKLPLTAQVFALRNFSFANVATLSYAELNSWLTGSFLAPSDGTLVRTKRGPTIYWVVGGVLHPVNRQFYLDRGLSGFPLVIIPDNDLRSFAKGDAYIR